MLTQAIFSCLLFFNFCLIITPKVSIHTTGPHVRIPEQWAPPGQMGTGQIHFLASSSFCLKTDLKHLENLSIQLKRSRAFFPRNSRVTCDLSDGLFSCHLWPFPASPAEPGRAEELCNGSNSKVLFVGKNPGGRAGLDWSGAKITALWHDEFLHNVLCHET